MKSTLLDLQDLFASLGRKARLVPGLVAKERGWRPRFVGVVVAVSDSSVNRRVVDAHEATFRTALPARTVAVRRWLAAPNGALAGVWFLPRMRHRTHKQPPEAAKGGGGGPSRVRRSPPRSKSGPGDVHKRREPTRRVDLLDKSPQRNIQEKRAGVSEVEPGSGASRGAGG